MSAALPILEKMKMSADRIVQKLTDLKMSGAKAAYELQACSRAFDDYSREEAIEHMLDGEITARRDRAEARLYKVAKLKFFANPDDFWFNLERGLEKKSIAPILGPEWVRRNENIIITGASGTGKSWVACAIAVAAIRFGVSARYFRTNELLRDIRLAHQNGTATRVKRSLFQTSILILDDFGLAEIDESSTEDLLDILDARCDVGATIVVGQLSPNEWHDYLQSAHMADAIVDRLLQRSHRITLKGKSLRPRLS
jgi:DNA replication protein DnaC